MRYQSALWALLLSAGMAMSEQSRSPLAETSETCLSAARIAGQRHNVPFPVLASIARAETGRKIEGGFGPWPWAVNVEGSGKWFATKAKAQAFIRDVFHRGSRNFDVGCFQINYYWHRQAFRSPDALLDPIENADYAAKFLRALFEESGDWLTAAGHYHSRNERFAGPYRKRVGRYLSDLPSEEPPQPGRDRNPLRLTVTETLAGATRAGAGSLFLAKPATRGGFLDIAQSAGAFWND